MRLTARITVLPALFILLAATAMGQSLMEDPQYRELIEEAEELEQQAATALEEGEYDRAIELSNQAEAVAQEAEAYAEQRVAAFRARGLLSMVENEMEIARSFDAPNRYPQDWETVEEQHRLARNQFSGQRYQASADTSRNILGILDQMEPARRALDEAQAPPDLPRYYIVRLIPEKRDCFWRIAGYDFVYGDPEKWRVLYEANKDILQDPDNPDLIQPGQRFRIPAVEGEQRAGVWNEEQNR